MQTNNGTCKNPLNLYQDLEIPVEGLLNYIIKDDLNARKFSYKPSCSKYSYNLSNVVYAFKLMRTMYIDIVMTRLNQSSNLDCILTITDYNCTQEYICSDKSQLNNYYYDKNDKSARLYTSLSPGYYKLLAGGFFLDNDSLFELDIKFAIDYNFQYVSGSCNNPILINSNFYSREVIQYYGTLNKDTYQTKLSCSKTKSPSVVYSFKVPNNTEIYFEIKLFGTENYGRLSYKLDTVLGITNSTCNSFQEKFCNDDSDKIEGLSSFLSVVLTSGKYNLIASGYDNDTVGPYQLQIFPIVNKVGEINLIKIRNAVNNSYDGSFFLNEYAIEFRCSNNYQTSNRYIIVPLVVSDEKQFNGTIELKAADGKNKMDTFIQIRDKNFSPIGCNDDSKLVGGLSSRIDTLFTSGEYRIILGAFGDKHITNFIVNFYFKD